MVKQASGVFLQAVQSAQRSGDGRLAQPALVYRRVREAIASGTLAPGTRLPSARQAANDWRVTRGAVDEAFAQLQLEGLVERRVGDGSYVRAAPALPANDAAVLGPQPSAAALRVLQQHAALLGPGAPVEARFRARRPPLLHPRAAPIDDFPLESWRRLVGNALAEERRDHLCYGPSAGLAPLRAAIARHLALNRGMACVPEQVLIVNSPLQGLKLVAQALLAPGDDVWVEDPSHPSLASAIGVLRGRPVPVPVDDEGLDVARGIALAPQARLVYTHPLVQYPTGQRTSAARCQALLDWATQRSAWIVEGCFNDELMHDAPARPALWSRDSAQRVLLLGTFEGVMFPSLRVAYLVLPPALMRSFTAMRGLLGDHTQAASQMALAAFIDSGQMSEHLQQLRQRCRERRDALRNAAQRELPRWARLGPLDGGVHACLHLPRHVPALRDAAVAHALRAQGVVVEPLSEMTARPQEVNALVLGYGAWSGAEIAGAVRRVGEVLRICGQGTAHDAGEATRH